MQLYAGWIAIGSLALLDAVWLLVGGFTLSGTSNEIIVAAIVLPVGLTIGSRVPRLRDILLAETQTMCLVPLTLLLMYLCASSGLPFRDAELSAIDKALHFDWLAYYHALSPAMHILGPLYFLPFTLEAAAFVFFLPAFSPTRAVEFVVLSVIVLSACCLISALLPAQGPLFYLHVTPDKIHHPLEIARTTLMQLRDGSLKGINIGQINGGLVVFPSAHAAATILYSYILRGTGILFKIVVVINAAMLFTVPVVGGHYLVDVIAGIAIAAVTILCIETRPARFLLVTR